MDERPVVVAAATSPELLMEMDRLRLENAQLRAMLEHLVPEDAAPRDFGAPRWRWLAGRMIAAVLFAAGVAIATVKVVESRPARQLRGTIRTEVRDRVREAIRERMRNGRVVLPAAPVPPVPPVPPAPPRP